MKHELSIFKTLKVHDFSNIEIDQIFNFLETLDYDLKQTKYVGTIISKNERLAKYFFLREEFKIESNSLDETLHINEILDQCIDWSEFWRLLVIKKGLCCICLSRQLHINRKYIFLLGPNILSGPSADFDNSIFDDD